MMKAKKGQTDTYIQYIHPGSHIWPHTRIFPPTDRCNILHPLLLSVSSCYVPYYYIYIEHDHSMFVCVCFVYSDHELVRSDRFYNLVPTVKALYTHCKKSELPASEVDVFLFKKMKAQRGRERLQADDESDEQWEERDKAR